MSHSSENELRKRGPKGTPLKIEEKSKKEENDDGLYDEPVIVRSQDSWPSIIRKPFYCVSGLVGVLIYLLLVLPFIIMVYPIAFLWKCLDVFCQCFCSSSHKIPLNIKNNEDEIGFYDNNKIDIGNNPSCCCSFLVEFVDECRLKLIEYKLSVLYNPISFILIQITAIETIINQKESTIAWLNQWYRRRNRFGKTIMYNYGIAVTDYKMAKEILSDKSLQKKGKFFLTTPINDTFDAVGSGAPILISSDSIKHQQQRHLIKLFLGNLHNFSKTHQSLDDIKHKISSSITTRNLNYDNIKREDMQIMIANLLMCIMTNGGILDKKAEDAVKYIFKVGLPTVAMDNITTFTLGCGYKLEREYLHNFMILKRCFIDNAKKYNKDAMDKLVKYCRENELNVSDSLSTMISMYIIAGIAGINQPLWETIKLFRDADNGHNYMTQYKKDKTNFNKEVVRYVGQPSVGFILNKDKEFTIKNKQVTIPKDTQILVLLGHCNRDIDIFGTRENDDDHKDDKYDRFNYANSFDPTRPNLDQILAWNGLESAVKSQDEEIAPRYCPGHDISLYIMSMITDILIEDTRINTDQLSKSELSLLKEEIKDRPYAVRFGDDFPTPIRQIYHLLLFILGIISLILSLLLVIIIIIFIALPWSICCDGICCCRDRNNVNDDEFYPTKPKLKFCCGFSRNFFHEIRLKLVLLSNKSKNNTFYSVINYIVSFYQIIEWILMMIGGTEATLAYRNNLANRFGKIYPYLNGLAVADYALSDKYTHDPKAQKMEGLISIPLNVSTKTKHINAKFSPTSLSTTDEKWKNSRALIKEFLKGAIHPNLKNIDKEKITNKINELLENKNIFKVDMKAKDKRALIQCNVMLLILLNDTFNESESEALLSLINGGTLFLILPSWFNFLLGGYHFERTMIPTHHKIKEAFTRNYQHENMVKFYQKCRELGYDRYDVPELLNMVVTTLLIAGFFAVGSPMEYGLNLFRKDKEHYFDNLYKDNKKSYTKECVRLGHTLSSVPYILRESETFTIGKKEEIVVPSNTAMLMISTQCNLDKTVFGDDTNESWQYSNRFDPNRENLNKMISFNGMETYLDSKNEIKAPRQCPGHDLALYTIQLSIDIIMEHDHVFHDEADDAIKEKLDNAKIESIHKSMPKHAQKLIDALAPGIKSWNADPPQSIPTLNEDDSKIDTSATSVIVGGEFEIPDNDIFNDRTQIKDVFLKALVDNNVGREYKIEDNEKLFDSKHDMQIWRDKYMVMPSQNVDWSKDNVLMTDEGMSIFAFQGIGCQYTKKIDINEEKGDEYDFAVPDNAVYINDFTFLSRYEVRENLEKYGAAAFFDVNHEIMSIYVSHLDQIINKQDNDSIHLWKYAKYVWKTCVIAGVTIKDHAIDCHLMYANTLIKAMTTLNPNHPIYRLLLPFTFRTTYINKSLEMALFSEGGFIERVWGFPYKEIERISKESKEGFRFKQFNKEIYDKSMQNEDNTIFPMKQDCNDFFEIMNEFVTKYINTYYQNKTEDELNKDESIKAFFNELKDNLKYDGKLNIDNLINIISNTICFVTGYHEHVGSAFDYVGLNLNWFDSKFYKKNKNHQHYKLEQSKVDFVYFSLLNMLISVRNPMLLNDFTNNLLNDEHEKGLKKIYNDWQNKLRELVKRIGNDNDNQRRFPFQNFNPKFMECSVSI